MFVHLFICLITFEQEQSEKPLVNLICNAAVPFFLSMGRLIKISTSLADLLKLLIRDAWITFMKLFNLLPDGIL